MLAGRADSGYWLVNGLDSQVVSAVGFDPDLSQLPLALLRPIIACASEPGDLILDPFCGNATTGVAALQAGRRFLGFEKREPIHHLATLRMKATVADLAQKGN